MRTKCSLLENNLLSCQKMTSIFSVKFTGISFKPKTHYALHITNTGKTPVKHQYIKFLHINTVQWAFSFECQSLVVKLHLWLILS